MMRDYKKRGAPVSRSSRPVVHALWLTVLFSMAAPPLLMVTVTWLPHEASETERKTFEEGRDSMKQGWGGTLDQFTAYLGTG